MNKLKGQMINIEPPFLVVSTIRRIYLGLILLVLTMYYLISLWKAIPLFSNPSFTNAHEVIHLSRHRKTAEHIGPDFALGSVYLDQIYTSDVHHVRFSFEQLSSSSKTFIGITNEQSVSYGWFVAENEVLYHKPGESVIGRIWRR